MIDNAQVKEEEIRENPQADDERGDEVNTYIIRRGKEKDVLQDVTTSTTKKSEKHLNERENCSQYTYADYQDEFEREKTVEELYQDDPRVPVECEITDGQTLEAGRIPDKTFVSVNIINSIAPPPCIENTLKSNHICADENSFAGGRSQDD